MTLEEVKEIVDGEVRIYDTGAISDGIFYEINKENIYYRLCFSKDEKLIEIQAWRS